MAKSILVLGASGFIGRQLCEAFADDGFDVVAATRRPVTVGDSRIRSTFGTFDTPQQFAALLEDCRLVVHAASSSTPGSSASDPLSELSANLQPTLALLDAMQRKPDVPLIYISSGGTLYGDHSSPPHSEGVLPAPRSFYGAAKTSAEMFISAWASQTGGSAMILRPSNVYGPGQHARTGFGVVPAAFRCVMDGTPFTIIGDGESVRDYLYIDDFVAACLLSLHAPIHPGVATFNVASGHAVPLSTLLDTIDLVTGIPLQRIQVPSRAVDVRNVTLDCSLLRQTLGWRPATDLYRGLELTWRWVSTLQ